MSARDTMQTVPSALVRDVVRDVHAMRRALSQIAHASAGDYLPGETCADYWRRFARELQSDARRALNGEG